MRDKVKIRREHKTYLNDYYYRVTVSLTLTGHLPAHVTSATTLPVVHADRIQSSRDQRFLNLPGRRIGMRYTLLFMWVLAKVNSIPKILARGTSRAYSKHSPKLLEKR